MPREFNIFGPVYPDIQPFEVDIQGKTLRQLPDCDCCK